MKVQFDDVQNLKYFKAVYFNSCQKLPISNQLILTSTSADNSFHISWRQLSNQLTNPTSNVLPGIDGDEVWSPDDRLDSYFEPFLAKAVRALFWFLFPLRDESSSRRNCKVEWVSNLWAVTIADFSNWQSRKMSLYLMPKNTVRPR